jgi:hypothetical protein
VDASLVLSRLSGKSGLALVNLPIFDRNLVLALAATVLPRDTELGERAVSEALREWLARHDDFLRVDHVELRRWLVDIGLWQRDVAGRGYRRVERFDDPMLAEIVAAVGDDGSQRFIDARAEHEREREERKAALLR